MSLAISKPMSRSDEKHLNQLFDIISTSGSTDPVLNKFHQDLGEMLQRNTAMDDADEGYEPEDVPVFQNYEATLTATRQYWENLRATNRTVVATDAMPQRSDAIKRNAKAGRQYSAFSRAAHRASR